MSVHFAVATISRSSGSIGRGCVYRSQRPLASCISLPDDVPRVQQCQRSD